MTHPTDDELEAMAREQAYQAYIHEMTPNGNSRITNATLCAGLMDRHQKHIAAQMDMAFQAGWAAAMLRACMGGTVCESATWNVDESKHGTLIYSLKQDGWRKGELVMVNDLTIRIENANGSTHDLRPLTARILSALEPAPDARQEAWRAGVDAAIDAIRAKAKANAHRGEYLNAIHVLCAIAEKGPTDDLQNA